MDLYIREDAPFVKTFEENLPFESIFKCYASKQSKIIFLAPPER